MDCRNVETLEKIPNVDHYRNIMSMAGAMATRPTLLDLHAEDSEKPADLEIGELQLPDVEVRIISRFFLVLLKKNKAICS